MTNQANISAEIRALATRLENSVSVESTGDVKVDDDVISKILPDDLSKEQLEIAQNFIGNAAEAFEVVVAEKSVRAGVENKDLKEITGRLGLGGRINVSTKWTRETKGASGEVKAHGRTLTKVTLTGSESHKSNLTALEEFAAASLG